ncbi:PREDICTED: CSC1-like protein At3g54510 [Tarenaya hassleriana]|uniref:CSC1-like protein At3g54510 n=1 Tax=Tarenaya hassleriana TaxID=28532 RepID=UPI00053C5736|nr:PREDICTED: CSC1-like protein At3g54510 [Tarenaya hassleriana]
MTPESLIASASINIALAFMILWLFSILKKQPRNSVIYFARRLSDHRTPPPEFHASLSLFRFLPSVEWIPRAFRVHEDEILRRHGLDALVVIRLFKFGIRFFLLCSFLGVSLLLPVDYYNESDVSTRSYYSMDSFTISNVRRGSNKLWVHFSCLWLISFYALYLLYKEYKDILLKRLQQMRELRHRADHFTVLVRQIPLCNEHKTRGCGVDHFFSKHHPFSYHSYQMLYNGKDLEYLLGKEKKLKKQIEDMRQKDGNFSRAAHNQKQVSIYDEKLREISHKICHLQSEIMLKEKELPVAFVSFKSRRGAALAAQTQQHSNPLELITEMAPEPSDVSWRNLAIPQKILPLNKVGVVLAAALLIIFFAIPVTAVQGIAKYEKLKKWFPPAMAIEFIPGLSSIVTGYLPSAILKGFMYIVPYAMLGMAYIGGSISKSREEIKACNMVFYFLMGNVFFLSLISGSLLDEIGESLSHPRDIPSHLAAAVSAQADFFMTYILTDGLSGFSLETLQFGLLTWDFIRSNTYARGKERTPYLFSFPYFRVIPTVAFSILIGMVYAVVAPLLLPFLVGYFYLGYIVYINQMEDVYAITYDTCGRFWPFIHHSIFVSIILMQVTMVGLFGLKSKPSASIATIPLILITIGFNEYCKIRFLPSFKHFPIQTAVEIDELDEENGAMEVHYLDAANAYNRLQPCLERTASMASPASFSQPLLVGTDSI